MTISTGKDELRFPFPEAPEYGRVTEVAPDVLWTRIPLPYRLDHVNVYLVRAADGWVLVDTGIDYDRAFAVWEDLFAGALKNVAISRVVVTHHHPDHVGLAGWICRRFGAELLTSQTAYLMTRVLSLAPDESGLRKHFDFYVSHGMSREGAGIVAIQGNEYLRRVAELPPSFLRLLNADKLVIGNREFRVLTSDGHAQEQIMLHCEEEGFLLAGDQVLEKISPNVSVYADEPNGDPLGHFLRSLRSMRKELPEDTLVLPGHRRPFYGLHARCRELEAHHEERCQLIRQACRQAPRSVADLVPVVFTRQLDPHQMSFAFTETLAHVNRLVRRGELGPVAENGRILFSVV